MFWGTPGLARVRFQAIWQALGWEDILRFIRGVDIGEDWVYGIAWCFEGLGLRSGDMLV